MRRLTITLGFTHSDRANDYSPMMDGYRPGAAQTLVEFGPVDVPGPTPEHAVLPDEAKMIAEACFAAMNAPDDVPVSELTGRIRAALHAAITCQTEAGTLDPDGVHTLSVGDTVSVGGTTLSCEKRGWKQVTAPAPTPTPSEQPAPGPGANS